MTREECEQALYEEALRLLPWCSALEEFRRLARYYIEHELPDVDRHHLRDLTALDDRDTQDQE